MEEALTRIQTILRHFWPYIATWTPYIHIHIHIHFHIQFTFTREGI